MAERKPSVCVVMLLKTELIKAAVAAIKSQIPVIREISLFVI